MSGVRVTKEGGTVEHAVVERPEALLARQNSADRGDPRAG
jgi:hypothetical protein